MQHDAAAPCGLKNTSFACLESFRTSYGDVRCIVFVKIAFFSKWIPKSPTVRSQHQADFSADRLTAFVHGVWDCSHPPSVFFLVTGTSHLSPLNDSEIPLDCQRLSEGTRLPQNPMAGSHFPEYNCNCHMYLLLDIAYSVVTVLPGVVYVWTNSLRKQEWSVTDWTTATSFLFTQNPQKRTSK